MRELKLYDGFNAIGKLNLYRNHYYQDGNSTEAGIIANAINEILPEYIRKCLNQPINDPLTLEELRGMDGEPVWLNIADGKWGLVNSEDEEIELSQCGFIEFEKVIGLAYRRKLETTKEQI